MNGKSLVTGWEMNPLRPAIIDSGCSSDTHPISIATKSFPEKIRPLIKPIQFDTAADPVTCKHGATVKFGVWDIPLDVCLSPGDPSLISVGQRVMEAGMSFFWIAGRAPCFVTADYKYIVVFDVATNVPLYAPCFEKMKDTFLGTFTLSDNMFSGRCGLEIGPNGSINSTLRLSAAETKKANKKWLFEVPGTERFKDKETQVNFCEAPARPHEGLADDRTSYLSQVLTPDDECDLGWQIRTQKFHSGFAMNCFICNGVSCRNVSNYTPAQLVGQLSKLLFWLGQ